VIVLRVLADRRVHAEDVAVRLEQIHGGFAEAEGLGKGDRDDMDDGVQLEAGLQLVRQTHETAQQLELAAFGLAILHSKRHPVPSPTTTV